MSLYGFLIKNVYAIIVYKEGEKDYTTYELYIYIKESRVVLLFSCVRR